MSRRAARRLSSALVAPLACAVPFMAGCGGGLPLLHPAQTLPQGDVRAFAGASANVATGELAASIRDATNQAASAQLSGATPVPDATYARGIVALASVAPGVAPVAGARVGLGDAFEGGLAYTGRAVRADVRRAFDLSETWAISVGAGGSAVLYGRSGDDGTNAAIPGADLARLHGWGADVPVLIGYASAGDIYMLWAGARAGWEHVTLDDAGAAPGSGSAGPSSGPLSQTLSATSFWGGGLVGVAAGFRHLHVAMEFDASYATVSGEYGAPAVQHVRVSGLTLAPAAALWWRF